jgi:hypothetical protein
MLWNQFQVLPADLLHVGEPPFGLSGPDRKLSTTALQRLLASKKTVEARAVFASLYPISRIAGRNAAGALKVSNPCGIIANFLKNRVIDPGADALNSPFLIGFFK